MEMKSPWDSHLLVYADFYASLASLSSHRPLVTATKIKLNVTAVRAKENIGKSSNVVTYSINGLIYSRVSCGEELATFILYFDTNR